MRASTKLSETKTCEKTTFCLYRGNMSSLVGVVLLVLAGLTPSQAFVPIGGGTSTHVSITGSALLQKVTETCRAVAEEAGHEFNPTVR